MLYASTIFVSAFLLFLVQPLIAKHILPWFGGTAAVWTICLVFFQFLLLAGYIYADRISRLPVRRQAIVHTVLVLAACLMLPVIPDASWKPTGDGDPTLRILSLLAVTIGLPYLVVCTTGPLVQSWFARVHVNDPRQARVYRLFALSNLASLIALVAYPFALEPYASLRVQSWAWSAGFLLFAALVIASAWRTERRIGAAIDPLAPTVPPATDGARAESAQSADGAEGNSEVPPAATAPRLADYALWLCLAALGTVMLLTITTHITQDVASVPFLWILPLALYLLTFILCFDSDFWYRRWIFWPAVIVLAPAMVWGLRASGGVLQIEHALPLFGGGLFAVCMFCHGELVRARPAPQWLTRFYLMVSLGGALGGLLVGVGAPRLLDGPWELPMALIAASLLLAYVSRRLAGSYLMILAASLVLGLIWYLEHKLILPKNNVLMIAIGLSAVLAGALIAMRRSIRAGGALLAALSAAFCFWFARDYASFMFDNTQMMTRNFYGTLRVKDYGTISQSRYLVHGVISHGRQYGDADLRHRPTSYYSESSGAGLAIAKVQSARPHLGVIGLGVGTIAAYGQPGGKVRYYEINPAVMDIAHDHFSYLKDSPAAVEVVLGDARLSMEREAAGGALQQFDVLVVDAFSSDSIPVHLITREALAIYMQHMKPDGVVAFHVSNRFLNLSPVVAQLAQDVGLHAVEIDDVPPPENYWQDTTTYVLVTRNRAFVDDPDIVARSVDIKPIPGLALWTDDYNNLFRILK
ncbi:spermidine synthase [Variovorax sp. VNK109]|uniref:spermidine synthase n=1 Tax=Variovorax sp. VNK109 TaxID=3400919 RepID=UPI003C0DE4D3